MGDSGRRDPPRVPIGKERLDRLVVLIEEDVIDSPGVDADRRWVFLKAVAKLEALDHLRIKGVVIPKSPLFFSPNPVGKTIDLLQNEMPVFKMGEDEAPGRSADINRQMIRNHGPIPQSRNCRNRDGTVHLSEEGGPLRS